MTKALVIGAGFGGIASALRLASRGHEVKVIEKLDCPGGRAQVFTKNGFKHDAGPTVITAPFLFDELFELFGKKREDYLDFEPLTPWYRFNFSDGTNFDYGGSIEDTLDEIREIEPNDCDGYLSLLEKSKAIYKVGFEQLAAHPFHNVIEMVKQLPSLAKLRGDQSVWQLVTNHLSNPKLQKAFSIQPLLVGGSPFDTTSIYGLIHFLERKYGIFFAKGGTGALVNGLVQLAEEQGVQFEYGKEIEHISTSHKKIISVRDTNGQHHLADNFIFNGDPLYLFKELLPIHSVKLSTKIKRDQAKLSMGLYVLYFGTTRKYDDVAHHTIVMGDSYKELLDDIFHRKKLNDDVSLYLHRPTATDDSFAPEGMDSFYVLCPVPNNQSGIDWVVEEPRLRERVLSVLEQRLLPGLSGVIDSPFSMTPDDFENDYRSYHGAGFSIAPLFTQSAWFRFHNKAEGFDNLYLTGAGTHPGAGLPGVVSSAKVVEKLIGDAAQFKRAW